MRIRAIPRSRAPESQSGAGYEASHLVLTATNVDRLHHAYWKYYFRFAYLSGVFG